MTTLHTYRGVMEVEDGFAAIIYKSGQPHLLGIYDTPEVAAMVWDTVAFASFGDFAILNFPDLFDDPLSELV